MSDSFARLPDDSAQIGKRIRLLNVTEWNDSDQAFVTVGQEAVVLVDSSGNTIGIVEGNNAAVSDELTHALLGAVIKRLDFLCACFDHDYDPLMFDEYGMGGD